jgi:hypothetical protein
MAPTILAPYAKRNAMSAYIFDRGRNGAKKEYLGIDSKRMRADMPNEKIIKLYTTSPL